MKWLLPHSWGLDFLVPELKHILLFEDELNLL